MFMYVGGTCVLEFKVLMWISIMETSERNLKLIIAFQEE